MARKFFRKFMPSREKVHSERALQWLRPIMNKPYLWHLNRHSVARAVGFGFFWSLIPIPGQSIPAVFFTIKARGNVPLALAATWLSNPFTLIPHWWSAYVIGKFFLRTPGVEGLKWELSYFEQKLGTWSSAWDFITSNLWNFYLPLMVGSIIEGVLAGLIGYAFVDRFWKWHARRKWRQSRERARLAAASAATETAAVPAPPAQ